MKTIYKKASLFTRVLLSLSLLSWSIGTHAQLSVTVNQVGTQVDPALAGTTVLFDVVFSAAINPASFTASDIDLTASTAPGIAVASITMISPTQFQVAVSTTTTAGTVVLSIPAAKTRFDYSVFTSLPNNTNRMVMAFDLSGNLWVPRYPFDNIYEIDPTGAVIGNFTIGAGSVPYAIAVNQTTGNIYIANNGVNSVTELSPTGVLIGIYPTGAPNNGIAINQVTGDLYVTQRAAGKIIQMNSTGTIIGGPFATHFNGPSDILIDPATNHLWVAETLFNGVTELDASGVILNFYTVGTSPWYIIMGAFGNVFTTNQGDNTVSMISGGVVSTLNTTGLAPFGMTIDEQGIMYVANYGGSISKITPSPGSVSTIVGTEPPTGPIALLHDACDNLYLSNNFDIDLETPNGIALFGTCIPINSASTSTDNLVVLPVKLTSFTSTVTNCTAMLNWSATNETNMTGYEVQQSNDGVNYSTINVATSNNNISVSSYSYKADALFTGTNYFRLKMTDHDGSYSFSKAIIVQSNCSASPIISPNPASDMVTISGLTSRCDIILRNDFGQMIRKVQSSSTTKQISVRGLANGIYIITVRGSDGRVSNLKLVKE